MSNFKQNFFDNGFITKLRVLSENEASNICDNYLKYLSSGINKAESIEHKTKSHLYFPWANEIIRNKRILEYVEQILGPNFVCWNSVIFHKYPSSKNFVSMHQDQNYWGIIHDKAISVQLAISESKIENGCLRILPSSHRSDYSHKDLIKKDNMLARGQSISNDDLNQDKLKNIELDPGECVLFHGNIVHGSMPNKSNKHRFCFTIRFLTTDNKIKKNLYYNHATLVKGTDQYNFFQKEDSLNNSNINKLKALHKQLVISQIEKYVNLKLRNNIFTKIVMFFLKFEPIRSFYYKVVNKA